MYIPLVELRGSVQDVIAQTLIFLKILFVKN